MLEEEIEHRGKGRNHTFTRGNQTQFDRVLAAIKAKAAEKE